MSAPEYRRLIERVRELVTQAEGQLRVIPVGRFAEDLPEGLPHGEQVLRTMPVTDFLSGQPRVEVLPIQLRPRLHAPTSSTQIRRVEIVLRVARALPLDAIKDNDARYDQSGLAAEDGEVICKALEWPPNLEHTSEGLPTGCISLVHQGSDSVVRSDAKGTGHPQILETLHRFAGRIFISEAAVAAPANVTAPTINVDGGGDPVLGSELVGTPGAWTDAVLYRYQWLRDGAAIAGETSLRYTVAAEDDGTSITLRETAYGSGGSASAESAALVPGAPVPAPPPAGFPSIADLAHLWVGEAGIVLDDAGALLAWLDTIGGYSAGRGRGAAAPILAISSILNGKPSLRFSGAEFLRIGGADAFPAFIKILAAGFTLAVAYTRDSTSSVALFDSNNTNSVAVGFDMTVAGSGATSLQAKANSGAGPTIAATGQAIAPGLPAHAVLRSAESASPQWELRTNGAQIATGAWANTPTAAEMVGELTFGASSASAGGVRLVGELASIVLIKRRVNDVELAELETWLDRYIP